MNNFLERKIKLVGDRILRIRGCFIGGPGIVTLRLLSKDKKDFDGGFKVYLELETALKVANEIKDICDILKRNQKKLGEEKK